MADETMSGERIEEILAAVPIFSRLDGRDLKKLAKLCVPRRFEAGETVIEEGAMGLGMFVITSGRVEVFKQGEDGGRVELGGMEEGDVLGEIALVDDQPRSASAVAQTETECLLLTRDSFETLVKKEPEVAWCIVPVLADRIRELHERAVAAEGRLHGAEAASASQPAASAGEVNVDADVTEESAAEDEDEEKSDWQDAMAKMFRLQYGLMLGGLTGAVGMARMWETFFKKMADESELADTDDLGDLIENSADSFVAAGRRALDDLEDLPQEMVDSFRSVYKEES